MRGGVLRGVLALGALGFALTLTVGFAFTMVPSARALVAPGTPIAVAPGVPDQGRSWELVTPPEVVSALLYNVRGISADGDHVFYMTSNPLPGAPAGAPNPTANLAVRKAVGWSDQPIAAPFPLLGAPLGYFSGPFYPGPLALSPDLETSIWTNFLPLGPGESEKEVGLFRREPDGAFILLAEVGRSGRFIGASEDMRRVFFTSEQHLLPGDANRTEGRSIYELDGPAPHLVDVDDEGALLSNCGSSVLGDEYGNATDGAISADGQRLFFSTRPGCSGPAQVYLRQAGASTTEISASQCDLADCGPEADVSFVGATPNGSSAFLVSAERLTDEDTNSYLDLYRYDVATGKLTLLSSPPGGVGLAVNGAPVHVSTDGARVYFRGTPQSGPEEGSEHLYLADSSGLRAVAPESSLIQISADGRYALLSTSSPLTSDDTDERTDLYRYDAEGGTITPVSVEGPAGGNGPFNPVTTPEYFAETAPSQPYRAMSEDGSRIFFSTAEQLVPQDHNEALDVYEWANGSLGLISSGAGDRPDVYLGATPDGRAVLFRTSATLLPSDRDGGEMDFYEARIGGGFPETAAAEGCGGPCSSPAQKHAERAVPASAKAGTRTIQVRRPGSAQRRRIVTSGWIVLLVEVPQGGHLSAEAQARIGQRVQTIASTDVAVSKPGPVRMRMRLSQAARERLAAGKGLQVHLTLRLSGLPSTRRVSFGLRGAS